ncbi:transcriptional regulator, AraC family [Paracidovorax avenae ATCC 19860]|uniref:Transcriptional regulator, AraC family n=1 Tax=Paracidovorax avenae (strain ATCC 19860 / DSM 7227 / CCUG 15838 / JCM 20985 / LMG 2117 / NCPPB 1011) TaxID=643561 RepID=F0Q368_PARA1|nr:helix-turn-helix domain-containing protein [Paracidovorax avenae]ADX46652.1 transcriptional regulator, AraC family [Paracidovorax avenae ATCC 19860]
MSDTAAWIDLHDDDTGPLVVGRAGTQVNHDTAPHSHRRGQLIGCRRGVLSVGADTGHWVIPARHAIWLPPGRPHSSRMHGPFTGWSLYVAGPACQSLPDSPCTVAVSPLLWEAALRCAERANALPDPVQDRLAGVILDELRSMVPRPLGLPMPSDARLLRIARGLLADPARRQSLQAWAGWAALSPRTLSRRFVAETSLSFTAWTQRVRLLRSLEWLADGQSVTQVALDLGYDSVSAFIALFKRELGRTPAAYFGRQAPADRRMPSKLT